MGSNSRPDDGFDNFERFLEQWSRRAFLRRMGAAAAYTAFLAGGLEFAAACANAGGGQRAPQVSAVKGGKIIEGSISDIASVTPLNSINSGDTTSSQIITLLGDGLLDLKDNGDLIPSLATEVPKPSADQLTYTFKLRDAKWSDGKTISADDVVFTYRLMFAPEFKDVVSRYQADMTEYMQSVEAPDQKTVVFKMKKVWAAFLDSYARLKIQPKHVLGSLAPKAYNTADFFSNPTVTSGPFKFVKWDKGQQVVLGRNESYWRGAPNLDQYILKVVTDAVVLAQQLKTGELDVGQPDASQWDNLATASSITRKKFVTPSFVYYGFNLDPAKPQSKMFGDKTVRKALQYALDRESMAKAVYFGQAVPGDAVLPSVNWAYNQNLKSHYPFDKKKAEQLLDQAGWQKGADGIRAKGDVKLKFEMNTNAGNKVRENLLTVMQQQWKEIGVEASPRPIQFQQLVTQLRSIRTFDVFLLGIAFGDTDPDERNLFTTSGIGGTGLNGMNYKNPDVDKFMDDALATTDRTKRKELYGKIQDILADELPAPILFYPNSLWGINKRVVGWNVGPYNTYQARPWIKDTFVTDGK